MRFYKTIRVFQKYWFVFQSKNFFRRLILVGPHHVIDLSGADLDHLMVSTHAQQRAPPYLERNDLSSIMVMVCT